MSSDHLIRVYGQPTPPHGVEVGESAREHVREQARDEAAALMRAFQRETSLFVADAVIQRGIDMLYD